MDKIIKQVKDIGEDFFGRPQLQNIQTKAIYTDVNCGAGQSYWHITSPEGEPEYPVDDNVEFEII